MLLASPQQIFRVDRNALWIVPQALNVDLVPERMNDVWKMSQIAAEAHRLFDQLTRALEIARQPRRKSKVDPCCYSSIKRKLFFNLAVALPIVSAQRHLEVPTRLGQISQERRSKTNNPVADAGLG